jgi:HEXXH motif-containing protein
LAPPSPASAQRTRVTPWSWRGSADGWFEGVLRALSDWVPDPGLELHEVVRDRLMEAARERQAWLYHPLVSAVTLGEQRLDRDFRLALWAAAHQDADTDLGSVSVPEPVWGWAPDGGRQVEPGRQDLVVLAQDVCSPEAASPIPVTLDVWIDSVGLPLPQAIVSYEEWSWAHHQPMSDEETERLQYDIVRFLHAMHALGELDPDCSEWVAAVTKVVVPLYGTPGTRFRSGSSAALPGLIFSDLDGPITQALESMVHESSHLWFCLAEAEGPLVDPAHDARYKSPLRADPRPLRGIFLAFHALAFMAAFYSDWAEVGPSREDALAELDAVRELRDDALGTLEPARAALTDRGRSFLDTTLERVVAYAG